MTEKKCPICHQVKSISEYGKYFSKERNKYRVQNYCNGCAKVEKTRRSAEYYIKHTEERKEYSRIYRETHKDTIAEKKRAFKRKYIDNLHPVYTASQLAKNWGVTAMAIRSRPDILEAYAAQIKLKRTIKKIQNEKQNKRSKKSPVCDN